MNKIERVLWLGFAISTVTLILAASIIWMRDHPYGIDWDEAEYFDRALADLARFKEGGIGGLGRSILFEDRIRPPAYRLLVFPFTLALGFSPITVRLVSLSFFAVSLIFTYLAARRIAGPAAGAFAVIFLCLSPTIIFSSIVFGTEYPLFVATAAMMYFLLRNWNNGSKTSRDWVGLGLALGLGALAKTSFLVVAISVCAVALLLSRRKIVTSPSPRFITKAAALGILVASPWWLLNLRPALWYARYASSYRHSLGSASLETWAKWLGLFAQSVLGLPVILLLVSMFLVLVLGIITKLDNRLDRMRKTVLLVCFVTPLPLLLQAPLLGTNYNPRHLAPSLILAAVGVGVLARITLWTHARLLSVGASILFGVQLFMTVAPIWHPVIHPTGQGLFEMPPGLVMARREQWDWEPLRQLADARGIREPAISFLGNGDEYNWAAITYPWQLRGLGVKEVKWLWRYEEGPINWEEVMKSADGSDMVLTAPDYTGSLADNQNIDNQYNYEFARRLEEDPRFMGPIHLTMGRFERADIVVFVNKALYGTMKSETVLDD